MFDLSIVFTIIVLVISVVMHEVAHGAAAASQGDMTAKYAGRLSLNPLKHLDPVGSFILPFALYILTQGMLVFGYAKPVPVNPYNFRDRKYGEAKVAAAGAAANFALALVFGMLLRFWPAVFNPVSAGFYALCQVVVVVNLVLAVFNLVPIPPLDGSRILFALLPASQNEFKLFLQKYGFIFLLAFLMFFVPVIWPIVAFLYQIITGTPLT